MTTWAHITRAWPIPSTEVTHTLGGPTQFLSTDSMGLPDAINSNSSQPWWAHSMVSALNTRARLMALPEVYLHSCGPIRWSRHQIQGPGRWHRPQLTCTLVGPLDNLGTKYKGPADGIDQTSPTLWLAHSMASAPRTRAPPMTSTEAYLHSCGPTRWPRHRTQGPGRWYRPNLSQTLAGHLDGLYTEHKGPADATD